MALPTTLSPRLQSELEFVSDVSEKMNSAIRVLSSLVERDAGEIVTIVALDLLRRIQIKTPVDTGRLRASFHMVPPNSGSDPFGAYRDRLGRFMPSGRLSDARTGPTEAVVGTNVEYAIYIEAGHSRQAPNGMISVSVLEVLGQMEVKISERFGMRWQAF